MKLRIILRKPLNPTSKLRAMILKIQLLRHLTMSVKKFVLEKKVNMNYVGEARRDILKIIKPMNFLNGV